MPLGPLLVTAAALAVPPPPVIGGSETAAHPAVGVLRVDINGQYLALCSGTLVAPAAVLTAAHCAEQLREWDGRELSFALGETAHGPDEATEILRWHVQPQYDAESLDHDLAILDLAVALETDPIVPNEEEPGPTWEKERLTLVGFGATGSDNGDIGTKRHAELYYLDFTRSHVMAYDPWGEKAACHGDSGGSLLRPDGTLAGVVSYVYDRKGDSSACEGSAVAAMRVDSYWWWIDEQLATEPSGDEDSGLGTWNIPDSREGGCGASVAVLFLLIAPLAGLRRT